MVNSLPLMQESSEPMVWILESDLNSKIQEVNAQRKEDTERTKREQEK